MCAHGTTPRDCPSILPDDTHEAAPLAAALLAALPAYAADDLLPEARKVATSD